jgi:hypothetical protein
LFQSRSAWIFVSFEHDESMTAGSSRQQSQKTVDIGRVLAAHGCALNTQTIDEVINKGKGLDWRFKPAGKPPS